MASHNPRVKSKHRRHEIPRIACSECGAGTRLVSAGDVFKRGIPGGIRELLVCDRYPVCDSYVAINRKYRRFGIPASRKVRGLRFQAHRLQEQIVRSKITSRDELYRFMSKQYHLRPSRAHIRYFDEAMCRRVLRDYSEILLRGAYPGKKV
jgi:hypothetical protein